MITSRLVVSDPAETTALAKLSTVKTALGITGNAEDDFLNLMIDQASARITNYLGVRAASDGTRTIGRETLVETFRSYGDSGSLILSRIPIVSITSTITEPVNDATTLETDEYEVDNNTGILRRMDGEDSVLSWYFGSVQVTYVAGWLLPNDTSPNLPADIEAAVIDLIKLERTSRGRDPLLKSEEYPGVWSGTYGFGEGPGNSELPSHISAKLDPYCMLDVG